MSTAEQDTPAVDTAPTFKFNDIIALPTGETVMVRLPNQFQHDDITTKARAAQARRMRQLRDPQTDAFVVLDADMDDLARSADKAALVEEIIGREWWKDHLEAIKDVQEKDEFSAIEEDMRRLEDLLRKPDDQRDADEVGELERHTQAYNDAVEAAREERQRPRREANAERSTDDLVADIRESRITAQGRAAFNRAFSTWEIAVGTYHVEEQGDGKQHPTSRYFADVEAVEIADPEIISALTDAYASLESQFNRGAVGNG